MHLGYGSLSGVEIWNNARVLDYLYGDPANGVAGLNCTGTLVNRKAACRTILPIVCDPPPRYGEWVLGFNTIENGTNWYPGLASSYAFGVAATVDSDSWLYTYGGPTPAYGEIPALPPDSDPGWAFVGGGTNLSAPARSTIPKDPDDPGFPQVAFLRSAVVRHGHAETVTGILYVNRVTGEILVTADGGASWSNQRSVTIAIVDGTEPDRYLSPALDDAPWYDPLVPESAEFAGLYVEEVTGLDAPTDRDLTDNAMLGGSLGPLRFRSRSLTVTGWLRAKTCCAAEYGLSWLAEALVGDDCDDCAMGDLSMFRCCPPEGETLPDAVDYVRLMHRVGLVDGPKVVDRAGTCCADCSSTMLKVQFTLASESPYIFSDAEWIAFEENFNQGPFPYDWSLPCSGKCPKVPEPWVPDCAADLPPAPAPFQLSDPCYCEPWETMRRCASFNNARQWNEVTTYIEVQAGQDEVRNLKIVAFKNQRGLDCPCDYEADEDWQCADPCAVIGISQIPAGGKLVIDSRVRSVTMVLPGGEAVPGMQFVSSLEPGDPFDWFDVGHCTKLCVVASIGAASAGDCDEIGEVTVPDALISIGMVNRFIASGS